MVGLPIGNLEDITLRALKVLKEIEVVVCEDTRSFRKLINFYNLGEKRLLSYYKGKEKERTEKIIQHLLSGESLALVSEAGTPLISDPGAELVKRCYELGIYVEPVPGPSALIAALSVSGLDLSKGFIFLGFLPKKKEKQKELFGKVDKTFPLVFFESPLRVRQTLENLLEFFGDIKIFMAREITKLHQEFLWANLSELKKRENFKGEFVFVLPPLKTEEKRKEFFDRKELEEKIKEIYQSQFLEKRDLSTKEIAKEISKTLKISTKEVYNILLNFKDLSRSQKS